MIFFGGEALLNFKLLRDVVVKDIEREGRGPALNLATNPARPQYAYVVNNLAQSVALVDLDEGKQTTSFSLSSEDELVRAMAIDVNRQGARLFILIDGIGAEIQEPDIRKEEEAYLKATVQASYEQMEQARVNALKVQE